MDTNSLPSVPLLSRDIAINHELVSSDANCSTEFRPCVEPENNKATYERSLNKTQIIDNNELIIKEIIN